MRAPARYHRNWGRAAHLAGGWNAKIQYQTDPNGLMLLGNRYYDPTIGRFISQDPAQDESNWYSYCGNNPLVAVDPTGTGRATVSVE